MALKKILLSASTLMLVPGVWADYGTYEKSYSTSLTAWERELDRRAGRESAPSQSTYAPSDEDSPWEVSDSYPRSERAYTASWGQAFAVEGFYARATKDLFKDFDELGETDLGGVSLLYSVRRNNASDTSDVIPGIEFYTVASFGYGNEDVMWSDDEKDEFSVWLATISVGCNLRWSIFDGLDLVVGPRVGVCYIAVENEYSETSYGDNGERYNYSGSKTEDGFGVLYGGRAALELALAENHALTLGFDYWGTTARAKFDGAKTKEQHYCVFSAGYKYSF